MPHIDVDHIFIFTKKAAQVSSALRHFGLSEGTPNIHPGQGTACRRFYFHNAYLELVYVIDKEEIRNPEIANMKLWERSQYQLTHYCPFGLCLRSNRQTDVSPDLIFNDGWRYYTRFLPAGQFANIAANEIFPAEPLLFEMPFFGLAPKNYPSEKRQPLSHPVDFTSITKIILTLPVVIEKLSMSMKKVIQESTIVSISTGADFAVTVEFDDCQKEKVKSFHPLIPLTIKW